VVALDPRYASRTTHEFVTGDVRGRLKLSSQVCVLCYDSSHNIHPEVSCCSAAACHAAAGP
jgi:hypothetical protein